MSERSRWGPPTVTAFLPNEGTKTTLTQRGVPPVVAMALGARWSEELCRELTLYGWWGLAVLVTALGACGRRAPVSSSSLLRPLRGALFGLALGVCLGGPADRVDDSACLGGGFERQVVELVGVLEATPKHRAYDELWQLEAEAVRCQDAPTWAPLAGRVQVAMPHRRVGQPSPWSSGDRVRLKTRVRRAQATRNTRDISGGNHLLLRVNSPKLVRVLGAAPASVVTQRGQHEMASELRHYGFRVGAALWLGDLQLLDPVHRELVRRAGLAHLFSASGLHLSLIVAGTAIALSWLPHGLGTAGALAVSLIYTSALGYRSSVLRALLALTLWASARGSDLRVAPGRLWSVSLLLLLIHRPARALEGGVWLSFSAVAGILLALRWEQLVKADGQVDSAHGGWTTGLRYLRTSLVASIGAQWAVHPLVVRWFGIVPVGGPLLHLAAGPLTAGLMVCSLLPTWVSGVGRSPLVEEIGLGSLCDLVASWMLALADLAGRVTLPAHGVSAWWSQAWMLCAVALLATWWMGAVGRSGHRSLSSGRLERGLVAQKGVQNLYTAAALTVLCLVPVAVDRGASMATGWTRREHLFAAGMTVSHRVEFLDVGQGDAAVLISPRGAILVDGGGWSREGVGLDVLLPTLRAIGVARLDAIVLSHGDTDHCRGLLELSSWQMAGRLIAAPVTGALDATSCEARLRKIYAGRTLEPAEGTELSIGGWRLRRPGRSVTRPLAGNDGSLVLVVHPDLEPLVATKRTDVPDDGRCVLFTGDVERRGESRLSQTTEDLHCLVLKVAHHGSLSSSSPSFLDLVEPRVAVISAGSGNRYGHPHPEVVQRLCERGVLVRRTDRHGRIAVSLWPHLAVASRVAAWPMPEATSCS